MGVKNKNSKSNLIKFKVKALVVGFGGMGCRHAFSLFLGKEYSEIFVIEPNYQAFLDNCQRIQISASNFSYVKEINQLPDDIEFAVIATTSNIRLNIFKYLILKKNIKKFLLEKVVFQSESQFLEAISIIEKYQVTAFCNFVNRYFPNYRLIKNQIIKNKPITMIVSGGEFGLACNSLHYVDLFQYLTTSLPRLVSYNLIENTRKHKRGNQYKEIIGQMSWVTESGDKLVINSQLERIGDVEISIQFEQNVHILNEGSCRHLVIDQDNNISDSKFEILYTSVLTNIIDLDIKNGTCLLPLVQDTKYIHCQLFNCVNSIVGISLGENTPIT